MWPETAFCFLLAENLRVRFYTNDPNPFLKRKGRARTPYIYFSNLGFNSNNLKRDSITGPIPIFICDFQIALPLQIRRVFHGVTL